jgi:hypothetical protein
LFDFFSCWALSFCIGLVPDEEEVGFGLAGVLEALHEPDVEGTRQGFCVIESEHDDIDVALL